jgi:hypothetical protein
MKLRRPADQLAGCMWLPRFIDKTRHHLAGTLDPDFVRPFCHPLATDGAFFGHFGLTKEEILAAVRDSAGDDAVVAAWFTHRPQSTPERIAAWNELAPNLGKEGFPVRRGFLWALHHYYGHATPDPRVVSVFTAIAYDEGFLDES